MNKLINIYDILNSYDVCILWCNINELSESHFSQLLSKFKIEIINEEEYEKIKRFRIFDDQKRSLLSILLMKFCIGNYYNLSLKDIKIIRNKGTKPHFKINSSHKETLNFNVSHDSEIVIIILSKLLVGIDIMKLEFPLRNGKNNKDHDNESKKKFFNNMSNVFDINEWNYINNDIVKFMKYWTIKESFVKCLGYGLYIDPKRLKIINDKNNIILSDSVFITESNIYLDNIFQNCNIYSTNNIIPNYYISFCLTTNNLVHTCENTCTNLNKNEVNIKNDKKILDELRKELKVQFQKICLDDLIFAILNL